MKYNISRLYQPKSRDEDTRRREYILNIILCISIPILVLCDLVILVNSVTKADNYNGVDFIIFTSIVLMYCFLLILSKKGYIRTASYILIISYWVGALHCGYQWGASLPATIILFIFVIFISSILINSKFGIMVTLISIATFIILGVHEYNNPEILSWRMDTINNTDLFVYSLFLILIASLSLLSNREIEKSLERARKSEKELRVEKDYLETRVIDRTKELKESQFARMNELEKFAEFGRLSKGLFHDLLSPLTAMVLHMEKIKVAPPEEIQQSYASLDKVIEVSKRMNENIERMRYSMKNSLPERSCNIKEEISSCIDTLKFKAREENVGINFEINEEYIWYGDPIKLHQIFLNIISNALDSFLSTKNYNRIVNISTKGIAKYCEIEIKDNGIGMSEETIKNIFDPFFTTKTPENGTGIGLTTVQRILKEINGHIRVESEEHIGTIFTILIPCMHDTSQIS
ncbi:MAG: hypothetical protein QG640_637 [Patescibacteria group bacterium]|nr:hypothetical protein [Patescibacteria group bacterium]